MKLGVKVLEVSVAVSCKSSGSGEEEGAGADGFQCCCVKFFHEENSLDSELTGFLEKASLRAPLLKRPEKRKTGKWGFKKRWL